MKYKNLYDMHSHSHISFDGSDTCEQLCLSAVKKNSLGIAITDHCDIDDEKLDVDKLCSTQLAEIEECRAMFPELQIIKGIEIGQGIYRKKETQYLIGNYGYDFVLGSIHNLNNMQDFYFLDYDVFEPVKLLEKYFTDLCELSACDYYDSLAHLTYPLRYISGRDKRYVDMEQFSDLIDTIFENIIKNKKALEINTSGYFNDLNSPLPSAEYIKRYKELGGKYITIGSDSHCAERMLQGIERGYDTAKQCGFEYITIYKNHEPMLVELK